LNIVKVRGERDVNSYVLSCSTTKEAVVIDPAEPAAKILAQMEGLSPRWIVATHGHPGHVAGKDEIKEAIRRLESNRQRVHDPSSIIRGK